jgi:hypothetical protein
MTSPVPGVTMGAMDGVMVGAAGRGRSTGAAEGTRG